MLKVTSLCAALLLASTACSKSREREKAPPAPEPRPPAPPPAPGPSSEPLPAAARAVELRDAGLAAPTSALYLPEEDVFLVANVAGGPRAKDDNGFIAKVSPAGEIVALRWIDGARADVQLDAPKGMAVHAGTLYVADIGALRLFDVATGAPKGSIAIKGATSLEDVAAGADGRIYVTDSGQRDDRPAAAGAVFVVDEGGKPARLVAGDVLAAPKGIAVADGHVWIAPSGAAELYEVTAGDRSPGTPLPAGGLGGLEALADGRVVVSSSEARAVYVGRPGGAFTMLAESVDSPGELAVDTKRGRVAVPLPGQDAVRFYPLPAP